MTLDTKNLSTTKYYIVLRTTTLIGIDHVNIQIHLEILRFKLKFKNPSSSNFI